MKMYTYEDQAVIEKELRRFKEEICGASKLGARMATVKIFSNGDIMSDFLIDDDGSRFSMDIKKDGCRVEKEHFCNVDAPFADAWRE